MKELRRASKGRAWTAEEDDRLKSLIEASVSFDIIAAKMKKDDPGRKKGARSHWAYQPNAYGSGCR